MREILFRGKRIDNGEWVEGFLMKISSMPFILVQNPSGTVLWFEVDPKTVGQFTGLTDKNGKKIFEGDILKYNNKIGYVNYSKGCFSVHDIDSENNPAIDIVMFEYEVEVIGNIHDNPELLEGEENDSKRP